MKLIRTAALTACIIVPLPAQISPPNAKGVAISHVHVNAGDFDSHQNFWTLLGGISLNDERRRMIQFPGIYISLRKQEPKGGTVGSVLNHFGFLVKNISESLAKWKAQGITVETGNGPERAFLVAPEGIRVEIIEDPSMPVAIVMHHVHLYVPDPLAAQAWYVKNFGAVPGKRGQLDTANIAGTEVTFTKWDQHLSGTKGRAVDHIGFEVRNLDRLVKDLETAGVQTEAPIRVSPNNPQLKFAYIADPWGTYIELTEGLLPTTAKSAR